MKDKETVITHLLTHIRPDLDAMMSVLLMKRFGNSKYPGIENAEVMFCDANVLPGNKSFRQLEKEGILALDVGGDKFDNHPINNSVKEDKIEKCATVLVAEFLDMIDLPEWKDLIEYTRLQDTKGHSLYSRDYLHHMVSLSNILLGINLLESDSGQLLRKGMDIIENIPHYVKNENTHPDWIPFLKNCIQQYILNNGIDNAFEEEKYKNINEWINRLNNAPDNVFSNNALDNIVSLKSIVLGAYYRDNNEYSYSIFNSCMDAIMKKEEETYKADLEFKNNGVIKKVDSINIVAIESENQLCIKAARKNVRCDILIYRNKSDGATTIFFQKNGPLIKFNFARLAGLIRVVESHLNDEQPDYRKIASIGTINGWFLHQTQCLLIKGSPKATQFVPSKIPINDLQELICFVIDRKKEREYNLSGEYKRLIIEYENPYFRPKN